jgi:hypothetical protein
LFAFWRVANNVDGLILSTYVQDHLILPTAHPSYTPLWYELICGEPYSRNIRTAPPPPPKKSFHPPSSRHATAVRSDDLLGSETGTSGCPTACLSQPSSEPKGCKPYVTDDFILFFLTLLFYPFYFPSSCIRDHCRPLLSSPAAADHVWIDAL